MEKYISKINISNDVNNGISKQLTICSKCGKRKIITNLNKCRYQKKASFKCSKCGNIVSIGEIYNFKTGTKLNKLNTHHNQQTLDNHIWRDDYDKI